jgi:hypothetical protein
MRLSDLTRKTKTETLVIDAEANESITISYRYRLITPRMVAVVNALTAKDSTPTLDEVLEVSGFIVQLIESWDITDDAGAPIVLDANTVTNSVPLVFQFQLFGVMFNGLSGEAVAAQASTTAQP